MYPVSSLIVWRRLLAVLVLIPSAGCLPDVAWLPDSSGFVYTVTDWPGNPKGEIVRDQGTLFHYDLVKKTRRTIAQAGTSTIRPALSPDGKRIAIADLIEGPKPSLQVVVYDLQGKEVQRSKSLPWGDRREEPPANYPQLFWAPRENKVLVHANQQSGIYDLETKQAAMLGACVPVIYGTTPIRPDGKGFLIARREKRIALATWDGKETTIKEEDSGLTGRTEDILTAPSAVCYSRWEGDVAVATWKGGQLRIDGGKLTAAYRRPEQSEWSLDGKEIQEVFTFPDGKTRIAVLYKMSFRDFRDAGLPSVRVDHLGPAPNQRRTLVEETHHCALFPAPNKELVALRYVPRDPDAKPRDTILVVNRMGETVAEIAADK